MESAEASAGQTKEMDRNQRMWGVIGCGRVVERFHGPVIESRSDWRISAAWDRDGSRRSWLKQNHAEAELVASSEELIHRRDLDALLVTSSPVSHPVFVMKGIRRGLPILVEKPFSLSVDLARDAWDEAKAQRAILAVGFNRRFRQPNQRLKMGLARMENNPENMEFHLHSSLSAWDPISPEEDGWDVLSDLASHQVDLLRWLTDREIVQIGGARQVGHTGSDVVEFEVELAGGLRVNCSAGHSDAYQERLRFVAAGRVLQADERGFFSFPEGGEWRLPLLALLVKLRKRVSGATNITVESFEREHEAFWSWCDTGVKPPDLADAEDGLKAVEAVDAIRRSLASGGEWVSVGASSPAHDENTASASQPSHEVPPGVDLSVVLIVGNRRRRGAQALASLLEQPGIDDCEVLLMDAGSEANNKPIAGSEHPSVRVIRDPNAGSFGGLRALGASEASGRWVAFMEEHVTALPGWLAAARANLDSPWSGIGGEMHTANPGAGISDVIALMNYTVWRPPAQAGETGLVPGQNNMYRRSVLEMYGKELSDLLENESVLNARMTSSGHRLYLDPELKFAHRNETTLRLICRGYFHWHRNYGYNRALTEHRGWVWRLARGLSWPLVPVVRAARMGRALATRRRSELPFFIRSLPVILIAQGAAALGTAIGALFGPGDSARQFLDHELNAARPYAEEIG